MAERRKTKRKKEPDIKIDDEKPSKAEYEIAKYLKDKLPPKKTTLLGHKVDYFIASKAIDLLQDSKWAQTSKKQKQPLFTSRDSIVGFMNVMLKHKFFHRAKTVIVKKEDKKKKKDDESADDVKEKEKEKTKKKEKEKDDKKDDKDEKSEAEGTVEKKKEKKKVKLDMHFDQTFVDGNEPFVWIYDHVPLKAWIIGAGLVIGAIAVCLFPLWPRIVRNYVYYLSIAAAAFLFFIIGLAVLRLVIFTLVWLFTFGKHHFWLLPNLTEDVGFFESFWPLYKYEYKGQVDKKKKKEKDKSDDDKEKEKEKGKSGSKGSGSESETNSKGTTNSQQSGNGNSDNGFEILDSNEYDEDGQNIQNNENISKSKVT